MLDLILWQINNIGNEPLLGLAIGMSALITGVILVMSHDGYLFDMLKKKTNTCFALSPIIFSMVFPFWHLITLTFLGYWFVEFISKLISEWRK